MLHNFNRIKYVQPRIYEIKICRTLVATDHMNDGSKQRTYEYGGITHSGLSS